MMNHFWNTHAMHRRTFLRGTSVALALPLLDAFPPQARAASAATSRTNMI